MYFVAMVMKHNVVTNILYFLAGYCEANNLKPFSTKSDEF